ncbi:MAG: DUF4974 domain-containing protein [Tannerellaceae bacterium]|jgi:ferric-dicitrate binding protein FerR (iron transport regulator)|nr:DUF4974 domain-containing protein [Tannerellaceae bacterium]
MNSIENIVNLVTGDLDSEDKKKILSEISTNVESKKEFYKIKAVWALFSSTKKMNQYEMERTYIELQRRIHRKSFHPNLRINPFIRYVAVLIAIIGSSLLFINLNKQTRFFEEVKYTTVIADYGQISKIILPDSSVIWLNSGTTMTYNNRFAITNRDLILDGQAHLEVKKENDNPLIVACKDLRIKVLGTTFDVNAYMDDEIIQIILESGKVQLLRTDDNSFDYQLKPGEIAQYNVHSKNVAIEKISPSDYASWKDGYLLFNETPLCEVIEQLERKFNVDIHVIDTEVYKSVFNAKFNKESLSEILNYIEYSCPIKYKIIKRNNEPTEEIEFYYHPK